MIRGNVCLLRSLVKRNGENGQPVMQNVVKEFKEEREAALIRIVSKKRRRSAEKKAVGLHGKNGAVVLLNAVVDIGEGTGPVRPKTAKGNHSNSCLATTSLV